MRGLVLMDMNNLARILGVVVVMVVAIAMLLPIHVMAMLYLPRSLGGGWHPTPHYPPPSTGGTTTPTPSSGGGGSSGSGNGNKNGSSNTTPPSNGGNNQQQQQQQTTTTTTTTTKTSTSTSTSSYTTSYSYTVFEGAWKYLTWLLKTPQGKCHAGLCMMKPPPFIITGKHGHARELANSVYTTGVSALFIYPAFGYQPTIIIVEKYHTYTIIHTYTTTVTTITNTIDTVINQVTTIIKGGTGTGGTGSTGSTISNSSSTTIINNYNTNPTINLKVVFVSYNGGGGTPPPTSTSNGTPPSIPGGICPPGTVPVAYSIVQSGHTWLCVSPDQAGKYGNLPVYNPLGGINFGSITNGLLQLGNTITNGLKSITYNGPVTPIVGNPIRMHIGNPVPPGYYAGSPIVLP